MYGPLDDSDTSERPMRPRRLSGVSVTAGRALVGFVVFVGSHLLSACGGQEVTARPEVPQPIPWCQPSPAAGVPITESNLSDAGIASVRQSSASEPLTEAAAIRSQLVGDPTFADLWMLPDTHELVVAFARKTDGVEKELLPLMAGSSWTLHTVQVQHSLVSLGQLTQDLNDKLSNGQLPTEVTQITENASLNRVVIMLSNPTDFVGSELVKLLPGEQRFCIQREPNAPALPK